MRCVKVPSADILLQLNAGLELEGQLLDEREIRSLLGETVKVKRDRDQVITAVSHRIECMVLSSA
jgi:hypothetical protein